MVPVAKVRSLTSMYRFYVIGDHDRILVNEVGTFDTDGEAIAHGSAFLTTIAGAKVVEIWERARLVHRVDRG